ncbi:MAG: amidophosphoribosyltransferase [Bacteroidia bacterium]|nr:amidophosphoribosyltransferase [Bacteroidia bacterium]
MSDSIKHECGIGLIRLLKPLSYYEKKYGSALWGLNKMFLLMEKQHNRGQDGAGLASIKLEVEPGQPYLRRLRNNDPNPWMNVVKTLNAKLEELKIKHGDNWNSVDVLQRDFNYSGELLMAHLRYGTHGDNTISAVHPVIRSNNWRSRSLVVAGNFNLTNVKFLFDYLVELGQHPRYVSDTETVLERIGHFLDEENERLFRKFKELGYSNREISDLIAEELDIRRILSRAASKWDGGYVMAGLIGSGDAFVARDPHGIRPCFYYKNDEFVVVASERPCISTVFNLDYEAIQELAPGSALIVKKNGEVSEKKYTEPQKKLSCSFERIYFSRGNDPDIYNERMELGNLLVPKILKAINYDLENTVFGYIPNTAETSFWGMLRGIEKWMNKRKVEQIREKNGKLTDEDLENILMARPRVGKLVLKDIKLRTFITDDLHRDELVAHVYDVTHGIARAGIDTLVCIDDSIVRGTTLRQSILRILDRLKPKKIIIVSSAPQIRFPDCYGIDMSQIERFVAFQAAIALLKDRGLNHRIGEIYRECRALEKAELLHTRNVVKEIYEPFTEDEISRKISELLTPRDLNCQVEIVYQPLENLSKAIPHHLGDWYFSGDFPTPGGNKVTNRAFLNYMEGVKERAY